MKLNLSDLGKTWIIDIDGTLLKHNGYKTGHEEVLSGVENFFSQISERDMVILITGRDETYRESTIKMLKKNSIRFDHIIFNAPLGERIVINDIKPSGLNTAVAVNKVRDMPLDIHILTDK